LDFFSELKAHSLPFPRLGWYLFKVVQSLELLPGRLSTKQLNSSEPFNN